MLLEQGEQCAREKKFDLAYVFYATYFEHQINAVIDMWCKRKSIGYKTSSSLIRKVSLEDKYTWLLEILGLPAFRAEHLLVIKKVAEKRNSFLHYKYPAEPATMPLDQEKIEWRNLIPSLQKTVAYTKRYHSRFAYKGKKSLIKL